MAAVEASMDAAVAAIEGAEGAAAGGPQPGGVDEPPAEMHSSEPARPNPPGS